MSVDVCYGNIQHSYNSRLMVRKNIKVCEVIAESIYSNLTQ